MSFSDEIAEIPEAAARCLKLHHNLRLPCGTPCIGMGSSLYAAQSAFYAGADTYPESASEFSHYVRPGRVFNEGILISQSGRSSETLWCRERVRRYTAVTNDVTSPLAQNARLTVDLVAGRELASASKTFVNTLVALFQGFGIDPARQVAGLAALVGWSAETGEALASFLEPEIRRPASAVLVIAGGPALGAARQAALILSECAKYMVQAFSVAAYDHGPKEAAAGTAVVCLLGGGPEDERLQQLAWRIERAGAAVFPIAVPSVHWSFAAIPAILPFNHAALILMQRLGIGETFAIGGKVTEALRPG